MKTTSTITKLMLASAIAAISTGAVAHESDKGENLSGYATNNGAVAKGAFGTCWKTQFFTAAQATEECDPDLIPKKQPVAAAPAPAKAAPAPAPAPAKVITTKVNLEADTYFDFDKADLKPAGKARIDEELAKLNQVELNMVIAIGHTDSIGSETYNQKLSQRRAEAVKKYMVSKGVPASLIEVRGMGESQPVATNKSREGRAKNRRVEIEIRATQKVVK